MFGDVGEIVYTSSFLRMTIRESILFELQKLNYQRIVFYNHERKFYFYDFFSKNATLDVIHTQPKKELPKSSIIAGPIPLLKVIKNHQEETIHTNDQTLHLGRLSDPIVLQRMDAIIKDKKIKTALIIDDADSFIRNFYSVPMVNTKLENWKQLDSFNENIILFIFSSPLVKEQMDHLYQSYPIWQNIFKPLIINDSNNHMIEINHPSLKEISYMYNYFRLHHHLKFEVEHMYHIAKKTQVYLIGNNQSIKTFEATLIKWSKEQIYITDTLLKDYFKAETLCDFMLELDALIGMKTFKDEVKKLIDKYSAELQIQKSLSDLEYESRFEKNKLNKKTIQPNLHYVFMGSPGTGKTTAAILLGKLFSILDFLPSSKFRKVGREDLVGDYMGVSERKTSSILQEQMGGVLFIDEAYSLYTEGSSNDYGLKVIDILVNVMTSRKGEFSLIIAGYTNDIEKLFNPNPGLKRRFGNNIIKIEDYEPEELYEIFLSMTKEQFIFSVSAKVLIQNIIIEMHKVRDDKWGNAGVVEAMRDSFNSLYQKDGELVYIDDHQIPKEYLKWIEYDKKSNITFNYQETLSRLNGGRQIIDILDKVQKRLNKTGKVFSIGHFQFVGSPGTGKTTTAKILGKVLNQMGFLKSDKFIEPKIRDFIGSYVGESTKKTDAIFEQAKGGVLFIDEVYSLNETNFKDEIINVINQRLDSDKDMTCVIIAGYMGKMEEFLKTNDGLKSRIMHNIQFNALSNEELLDILQALVKEEDSNIFIEASFMKTTKDIFEKAKQQENFGNARFVRNFVGHCLNELYSEESEHNHLSLSDRHIPKEYKAILDKESF